MLARESLTAARFAKCCEAVSWERRGGVEVNLVLIMDVMSAFEA